jgi:hypothetical protein
MVFPENSLPSDSYLLLLSCHGCEAAAFAHGSIDLSPDGQIATAGGILEDGFVLPGQLHAESLDLLISRIG